jgi:hypothetical protein
MTQVSALCSPDCLRRCSSSRHTPCSQPGVPMTAARRNATLSRLRYTVLSHHHASASGKPQRSVEDEAHGRRGDRDKQEPHHGRRPPRHGPDPLEARREASGEVDATRDDDQRQDPQARLTEDRRIAVARRTVGGECRQSRDHQRSEDQRQHDACASADRPRPRYCSAAPPRMQNSISWDPPDK